MRSCPDTLFFRGAGYAFGVLFDYAVPLQITFLAATGES